MPQKKSGFGGSSTGLGCHSFLSINIFILRGMDGQLDIEKIRRLVAQGKYEFSKHAERERQIDMIHTWELEDALRECRR
ncbi:MAG: hypothetical protein Q8N82_06315 [Deltaproteobacteria bacterium]|nr:hypothetical protein [Deltaproteobacteria bacterium]